MRIAKRTFYVATDGREFTDREKCLQYEADGCVEFMPLPRYGDHVAITDKWEWMLDGDGSCYYATATKMTRIHPASPHPKWATHIIYFGK